MVLGLGGMAVAPMARPQNPGPTETRLLRNQWTRMSLEVAINGRRGPAFVVDTGAGRTVIAAELAAALELPPGPDVMVHGITAAQVTPTVRIARFGMAGRRFNDLVAPVFPRAALAADGLIGLDVLGDFRLELDLERRQFQLAPSGSDVINDESAIIVASRLRARARPALRGRFGQLILPSATANGIPTRAFVDTGAQVSIGNLALLDAVGGDPIGMQRVEIHGVTGQTQAAASGQIRDLRIGAQSLGPSPLLFADLHVFRTLGLAEAPAILIGADLLFRFRAVTLDFGRARMAFSGLRRRPTVSGE